MQALLQLQTGSRGQPSLHLSCMGSELQSAGLNGLQVLKEASWLSIASAQIPASAIPRSFKPTSFYSVGLCFTKSILT